MVTGRPRHRPETPTAARPAGLVQPAAGRERARHERAQGMLRRTAVVLYVHHLFGEGIARLLEGEESLRVVCVNGRQDGAHEQVRRLHPDVVIVEGDPKELGILDLFREVPRALVIRVELYGNTLDVYRARRVSVATPDDLTNLIRGRRRPRPTACPVPQPP